MNYENICTNSIIHGVVGEKVILSMQLIHNQYHRGQSLYGVIMKKTIEVLHKIVRDKIIQDYAIGGAVGQVMSTNIYNLPPQYFKSAKHEAERIFRIKEKRRKMLAKAPIEEKIKILIKIQERAVSIRPELRKNWFPWKID